MAEQRAAGAFEGVDFDGFWDDDAYSLANYVEPAPSPELIASIEAELGCRLPDSFVELAHLHNGGMVARSCYPMSEPTGWAEDHIQVTGIYALGRTVAWSLGGQLGSRFMQEEWGYPDIGVGIADTPTAGHEQLMLDYRDCGPRGEPSVVYVDQENDYSITFVAPDFATFIHGLVDEEEFNDPAEELAADLAVVERGSFSPVLTRAIEASGLPDGERLVRALATRIVREKGFLALHADPSSHLLYDTMFWLYSHLKTATSYEDFIHLADGQLDYERPCYGLMITTSFVALPQYGFQTTGYAEGFLREWWDERVADGRIVAVEGGYRFNAEYSLQLLRVLRAIGAAS